MIGTKFYKPLQNDELPVFEDIPQFKTEVVLVEVEHKEQAHTVNPDGTVVLDEQGNPVVEEYVYTVKEPKLDEHGNPLTKQVPVIGEDGKQVTQREQVGTKPNDAPNTLSKYAQAANWCNENKATIEDKGEYYEVVALPEPTAEELAEQALAQAKQVRAEAVEALTVTVDGYVFDADETSQARMAVAAASMTDNESNIWVLHDNSVVRVTKAQLLEACRLARLAQSAIWTKPYENASA